MPMTRNEDFGTNKDGSRSSDYCAHCFSNGAFTEPRMTLEQMIERLVQLAPKMNMPESKVRAMAKKTLPDLKRWRASAKKRRASEQ
jgi:hypothetical protein